MVHFLDRGMWKLIVEASYVPFLINEGGRQLGVSTNGGIIAGGLPLLLRGGGVPVDLSENTLNRGFRHNDRGVS